MKKILFIIVFMLLVLSACTESSKLELNDFIEVYIEAGYTVDAENKPLFGMIQASNGVMFYDLDGYVVKIYEYKSVNDLKKANVSFFAAINGRFAIESSSQAAVELFKNIK